MPLSHILEETNRCTNSRALLDDVYEFIEFQTLKMDLCYSQSDKDKIQLTILNAEILASRIRRRIFLV
jgi:hypothetical protein